MRVLIVLAHPDPASFNHAIAQAALRALTALGHQARLRDLYAEGFDPCLPAAETAREAALPALVAEHCAELARAEGVVMVHPNWWGMPPAILKGWVDRVVRPGVAYEFLEGDSGEGVPRGLLQARAAVVFNTSNTEAARERAVFGDPLERIWRDCVFGLCGVERVERRMFGVVVTSTPEERRAWLDEVGRVLAQVFPAAREASRDRT